MPELHLCEGANKH